jgi:hypothetical protein
MFWQAFYAVVGCVIGAAVLGNWGALVGTVIGMMNVCFNIHFFLFVLF